MTRYFNSGLYIEAFFTEHEIDFYSRDGEIEKVEYNYDLLAKHYKDDFGLEYKNEDDECEQVHETFWESLSYWLVYFEPLVFDEEIALECALTPFMYDETCLLALSGCGMDLSPRLDAYQALTDGTIDKHSRVLSDSSYFDDVVGKETTAKVLKVLRAIS